MAVLIPEAERLRQPDRIMEPDPRSYINPDFPNTSLLNHHAQIAALTLHPSVPQAVAIQFETARNLYLYSWYVYRFYMVSASQAYAALELGLRTRLPKRLPEKYQKRWHKEPMLGGMLSYAIDQGYLSNEGFNRWHQAAEVSARQRRMSEVLKRMIDEDLDELAVDQAAPVELTAEDRNWDLLKVLRESIPYFRNTLAHGSTMLTNQTFGTLEVVAEILNQIYSMELPMSQREASA